jgi:hypothetical protein
VIGAPEGLSAFETWCQFIQNPIANKEDPDPKKNRKQRLLWTPFPGFEAAFHATWYTQPAWRQSLDCDTLLNLARHKDANKRAYNVVNMYHEGLRVARERDENFDLIICVVPDEVYRNCRPQSRVRDGHGRPISRSERNFRRIQPDMFGEYDPEEYELSVDFRRQLKARAMEFSSPLPIIRESTLRSCGS